MAKCDCKTIQLNGETYHRGSCASHGSPALDREKEREVRAALEYVEQFCNGPLTKEQAATLGKRARAALAI